MSSRIEKIEQVVYFCDYCAQRIGKKPKKKWITIRHDEKGKDLLPEHFCSQECFDADLKMLPLDIPIPRLGKKSFYVGEVDPRNRLSDGPSYPPSYYRGNWDGKPSR